jgi:hypothetical protein
MTDVSIVQPAVRQVRVHRPRGSAQPPRRTGRALHLGPGGLAQRRALLEARWRDGLERVSALSVAYHDAAQSVPSGVAGARRPASRRVLGRWNWWLPAWAARLLRVRAAPLPDRTLTPAGTR